jgi:hypothetical protein
MFVIETHRESAVLYMCDPVSNDVSHQLACCESGWSESAHGVETRPNLAVTDETVEPYKNSSKEVNLHPKIIFYYQEIANIGHKINSSIQL